MKRSAFASPAAMLLFLISAGPGQAAESPSLPQKPLFCRHIVPILSKLGCNAGGNCHGAVKGQNGFRLSLWGTHPDEDHTAILRTK